MVSSYTSDPNAILTTYTADIMLETDYINNRAFGLALGAKGLNFNSRNAPLTFCS